MSVVRSAGMAVGCLVLITLALVPAGEAGAQDGGMTAPAGCLPPTPGTHRIIVNAAWPPVLLHVPPVSADGAGLRPLVLVLPGTNQTGRQVAALTGYSRLANQRHFLVAYPTARGPRPAWSFAARPGQPDDDLDYLRAVILRLRGPDACADPTRIGVTGVSNGGGMTARLACDAADLIAAAAPVAGGYSTLPACSPPRRMPVLEIHGARDPIVPINGKGPDHAGSVASYLAGWTARDGCAAAPSVRTGPTVVTRTRWACAGGTVVQHDRVEDVGHDWPGEGSIRPFSATVATWQFLSAFRLPPP